MRLCTCRSLGLSLIFVCARGRKARNLIGWTHFLKQSLVLHAMLWILRNGHHGVTYQPFPIFFCSNLLVEKFRISHFTCILTHVEDVKQRMEAQVPSLKRRKKLAKQARAARKIMSAYREPNTFDITVLPLGASLPSNGNFEFFFRIPSATEVTRESPSPRCISSAVTTN